jgi:hypothetical protein
MTTYIPTQWDIMNLRDYDAVHAHLHDDCTDEASEPSGYTARNVMPPVFAAHATPAHFHESLPPTRSGQSWRPWEIQQEYWRQLGEPYAIRFASEIEQYPLKNACLTGKNEAVAVEILAKHYHDCVDSIMAKVISGYVASPEFRAKVVVPLDAKEPRRDMEYYALHTLDEKIAAIVARRKNRSRNAKHFEGREAADKAAQKKLERLSDNRKAHV